MLVSTNLFQQALHVQAVKTHVDSFGKPRRQGEEWLITHMDTKSYITSVNEKIIELVRSIDIRSDVYCIIMNPIDDAGVPCIGKKLLVRGKKKIFLRPGESIYKRDYVHSLAENEGIILRAEQSFQDGDKVIFAVNSYISQAIVWHFVVYYLLSFDHRGELLGRNGCC